MNLRQTLDSTGPKSGKQTAFKESISLFLALSVYGIFAVKEPVKELGSLIVGKVLCQFHDAETIKAIGQALLAIGRSQFQLVSGTNQFRIIFLQLIFEILPVIPFFGVVGLFIQHRDNILWYNF